VTTNHILSIEVVLPDGTVTVLGSPAADTPGYDLVGVFVGSEGTFGIATRILVRLTPLAEGVKTILAIYNSVVDACQRRDRDPRPRHLPAAIEMIDQKTMRAVEQYIHAGFPDDAAAALLVEVDGLVDDLELQAVAVMEACKATGVRSVRIAKDEAERAKLWKGRKQAFGALGRLAPNYYTHDGVIPRTKLPEVLDEIYRSRRSSASSSPTSSTPATGISIPVILYDEREEGVIDRVRKAGEDILKLVCRVGGGLSGEHGIGIEKLASCATSSARGPRGDAEDPDPLQSARTLQSRESDPSAGRCVEPGPGKKLPIGH
jgi:glycolate oxidase